MCSYLQQCSLAGSSPPPLPGAFQMAGSSRSFCQGLEMVLHEWCKNIVFGRGVQPHHEKPMAKPRCCTPRLCIGFANALPRLLVKHSQHTQMRDFYSFSTSK